MMYGYLRMKLPAMRTAFLLLFSLLVNQYIFSQPQIKELPAKRATTTIKIDGNMDEAAWKEALPATNFVEQ
ncbi:MAG: hypothetical protein ABIQ07_09255, partial [Ginsengibacter sp.]